ncbi:alpha/beta fold hydrolase [Bifidobacterium tissieri]|nr:alpha/beta hydrolase [Bifidobacterium tissieri]
MVDGFRFPRVPQFGPFDTPGFMRTFGIDCSVGRLTAMASRNLDTAKRVAVFIPGYTGSKEDFIPFFPYLWRELRSGYDASLRDETPSTSGAVSSDTSTSTLSALVPSSSVSSSSALTSPSSVLASPSCLSPSSSPSCLSPSSSPSAPTPTPPFPSQTLPAARPDFDPHDVAIVAYSQRGQADSAAPNDRNAYELGDFVADGCEVLERLGAADRPIDLVGHSFGGVVARRVALRRPELLRSLTVFDSGAVPVKLSPVIKAGPFLIRLLGSMSMYWAYRPKLRDAPQADRLAELFRQCMHASSKYHLASVADFMTKFDDVTEELNMFHVKHDVPINIMYGRNDDVWPNEVYDTEASALGITPVVFEDAAHLAQDDQPEDFARALVRFWAAA